MISYHNLSQVLGCPSHILPFWTFEFFFFWKKNFFLLFFVHCFSSFFSVCFFFSLFFFFECFFCVCFFSFFGLSFFLCFFLCVCVFFFFVSFSFFFDTINMLGFLTLPMVKGGITRDAFTQKVAATGDSRSSSRVREHENFRLLSQLHVAVQTPWSRCPSPRAGGTNRWIVHFLQVSPFLHCCFRSQTRHLCRFPE